MSDANAFFRLKNLDLLACDLVRLVQNAGRMEATCRAALALPSPCGGIPIIPGPAQDLDAFVGVGWLVCK